MFLIAGVWRGRGGGGGSYSCFCTTGHVCHKVAVFCQSKIWEFETTYFWDNV